MFSQTAEYALRAAVTLAEQGRAVTASELAELTSVPPPYLFKVMRALVEAGVAVSQRGKYGGYLLARPAGEMTLLDVVNAVDPLPRIRRCPLGKPEHAAARCPLHRQMDAAYAQMEAALGQQTLAQLSQA